jgi:pSer/pThr/pTyr-binding forkhead associated (FHA) protein
VRDLGSRNGTFINGNRVDLAESDLREIADWAGAFPPDRVVHDGDLLTVGGTTLSVDVVDCPVVRNDSEGKPSWEARATVKKDCSQPLCDVREKEAPT